MLELKNVENNVLVSLSICGYQFPKDTADDWCLVKASISQGEEVFEKVDPALEASELLELHSWFKALSENRLPRYSCLSFTEPCLSFEYLSFSSDIVRFGIKFSNELKPNFELNQLHSTSKNWNVVFGLKLGELASIAASIEHTCKNYPVRAKS